MPRRSKPIRQAGKKIKPPRIIPIVKPKSKKPVFKKATVPSNKVVVPASAPKVSQNGICRPRPNKLDGSPKLTKRVWDIADEISAKHAAEAKAKAQETKKKQEAQPATRAEVLAQCLKEGIKYSTFSNQFYHWRKFFGIVGRLRKDGVRVTEMGPGHGPRESKTTKAVKPTKAAFSNGRGGINKKKTAALKATKPTVATAKPVAKKPAVVLPFVVPSA